MSIRGTVKFTLNGFELEMEPSFKNLARIEDALNCSVSEVIQSLIEQRLRTSSLAVIIQHCAKPMFGNKYPEWWSRDAIGQAVLDDGVKQVTQVIIGFLADAVKAAPSKTIADDDQKKT